MLSKQLQILMDKYGFVSMLEAYTYARRYWTVSEILAGKAS